MNTDLPALLEQGSAMAMSFDGKAKGWLSSAKEIEISSSEQAEAAGAELRVVKTFQRQLEDKRREIMLPLLEHKKKLEQIFDGPKKNLEECERLLKRALGSWQQRQAEVERKARAEAEAKTREEMERLRAEEENARAAAQEAAETARRSAEEGNNTASQAAMDTLRIEQQRTAEVIAAKQALILSHTEPEAPSKMEGISQRLTYKADVVDLAALLKAILEGRAPMEAIQPNMKFLDAQARAFKKPSGAELYPGVVSNAQASVVARSFDAGGR